MSLPAVIPSPVAFPSPHSPVARGSQKSARPLMAIRETAGVYADALLLDERNGLLFISLWGRDTAMQELLARLSLPVSDGGLQFLHVATPAGEQIVNLDRIANMEKHSGRLSPRSLFGSLAQVWIFDRMAIDPDRANRLGLMLFASNQPDLAAQVWQLVREISHIPLLPHWRDVIWPCLQELRCIKPMQGIGISGCAVDLSGELFEGLVSKLAQSGKLTLSLE